MQAAHTHIEHVYLQMAKFLGCDVVAEKIRDRLASALTLAVSKAEIPKGTAAGHENDRVCWNQVRPSNNRPCAAEGKILP